MEKEKTDKIITDYMKKIYGFALSKTKNIDKAEELASRIVFEVYKSLLKAENIYNIEGYIFRIASNIYARFIIEEIKENELQITQSTPPTKYEREGGATHHSPLTTQNSPKNDNYTRLRSEITYLSKTQREIIIMFYFQKMKLNDIARRLNIPAGTVGWHLNEARNQIKDAFSAPPTPCPQSQTPYLLKNTSYHGFLGPQYINLSFYFTKPLTHNIVYSAYHKAKTPIEIAKELNVPVAYIEDEISHLENNFFMKKLPGNKYLTKIYISEPNKEKEDKLNKVAKKYSKIICERYISQIINPLSPFPFPLSPKFYTPQNDTNFLLWSLISFACSKIFNLESKKDDLEKFMVERNEGGVNIALAELTRYAPPVKYERGGEGGATTNSQLTTHASQPTTPLSPNFYYTDFYVQSITNDTYPINLWIYSSPFDDRLENFSIWTNNLSYEMLYDFMSGKIKNDTSNIDTLATLFENGLIISSEFRTPNSELRIPNIVITTYTEKELISLLPPLTDDLINLSIEIDEKIYKILKPYYPAHLRDLCKALNKNFLASGKMRVFIIEHLLNKGILKPLQDEQKKTVNMIMFTDILPPTSYPLPPTP